MLLVCGLFFVGNEDLRASKFRIDVLEWMENFFVVENNANSDKDDMTDVLFDESQIGYIPEGFEKVFEEVTFSKVRYKYQNDNGDYINIGVYRSKSLAGVDNEEIEQDIKLNEAGLEYRYVYKEETGKHVLNWTDKDGKFYVFSSSIEQEEILKVMNSISY